VEEIQDARACDAGEQVFVATGETHDLVWENRPDDDKLVVVEEAFVDVHRHIHGEQAAGELADLVGRDVAEVAERRGVVPLVIDELDILISGGALHRADADALVDGVVGHRRVRAQRDHDVKLPGRSANLREEGLEHQADGRGARGVRDDEQHALPAISFSGTGRGNQRANLRRVE
jgi:hypothetical protein